MKKLLSLLLTLCMLLGCIAQAEEIDYTGTWVCTNITEGDMSIDPTTLGMMITMTLNADGTGILDSMGETENAAWAVAENGVNVTDSLNDTVLFTYTDGALVGTEEGSTMTFTRESEVTVAPAATAAAPATEEEVAAFNFSGYWNCTQAIALGMPFNAADLGVEMLFALYLDGTFEMVSGEDVGSGTWAKTAAGVDLTAANGNVLSFTLLSDGTISLEQAGATLIFSWDAEESSVSVLTNVPVEQFMGTWVFEHAELDSGMYFTPEELELAYTLTLAEENSGTMYVSNGIEEATYPLYYEIQEIEGLGTVAYTLLLNPENTQEYFQELILMLYSDGQLVWYDFAQTEDDVDVYFCFDRQVTEAE